MRVGASQGGERATSEGVARKPRTGELPVPFANLEGVESLACGFRQEMLSLRDDDGNGGEVATGAGLGSDFIVLAWGEHSAVVRGLDLLRAWVETVDPEAAKAFPAGLGPQA